MEIRNVMRDWLKVEPGISIVDLAKKLDKRSIGSALVIEGNKPLGVITERDILRKIVISGKNPKDVKVREIMSTPVITMDVNEDIRRANKIMEKNNIRRLAIAENGKIIGKISTTIISRNLRYLFSRDLLRYGMRTSRYKVRKY